MKSVCSERIIHPRAVKLARESLPASAEIQEMGVYYKALGDPTRLKILFSLDKAELCVCDISVTVDMTVSAVSHQLAVLRQARLVTFRREGKAVFYSLADDHVKRVLRSLRAHLSE